MYLLEETFLGTTPTDTEVNDWIWFDRDMIYECCGLDENGEEPKDYDEEAIENSLAEFNATDDFEDFCCDCETCCLNHICGTQDDCRAVFENVKNQIIPYETFVDNVQESYGY
jgi:hypothetical protein